MISGFYQNVVIIARRSSPSPDDRVRQHLGVAPVGGEADPVEPRDARHQLLRQHRHLRISGEQILPRNLYI